MRKTSILLLIAICAIGFGLATNSAVIALAIAAGLLAIAIAVLE